MERARAVIDVTVKKDSVLFMYLNFFWILVVGVVV